jgi:uncharacterized protein (TIGR02466 family)
MTGELIPLFAVPFLKTRIEGYEELNRKLKNIILECEKSGEHFKNNRALVFQPDGLYESKFDFFNWSFSEVKELEKKIFINLYQLIGKVNNYDQNILKDLHIKTESWFHVMRNNAYFPVHSHSMASWSGVYCVDPGDTVEADERSGRLEFINPHPQASTYVDMANANLKGVFETGHVGVNFKEGELVLFPSWLQHYVLPYKGSRERITVAFNAMFSYRGSIENVKPK